MGRLHTINYTLLTSKPGIGLKVSNHSVCQQHVFYTSQGQHIFCVNHNKSDMQNLGLPRAIENCLACQV